VIKAHGAAALRPTGDDAPTGFILPRTIAGIVNFSPNIGSFSAIRRNSTRRSAASTPDPP